MSSLPRVAWIGLLFCLGVGILDVQNTYGMRLTALITLTLLFGAGIVHYFMDRHAKLVRRFLGDLDEIKKLVNSLETDERAMTQLKETLDSHKAGRSQT